MYKSVQCICRIGYTRANHVSDRIGNGGDPNWLCASMQRVRFDSRNVLLVEVFWKFVLLLRWAWRIINGKVGGFCLVSLDALDLLHARVSYQVQFNVRQCPSLVKAFREVLEKSYVVNEATIF